MTQTPISAEQVEAAARALCRFGAPTFLQLSEVLDWIDKHWQRFEEEATLALTAAASIPASRGETVSPAQVAAAMLEAWNDVCSDTGCHPLDIERQGKNLTFAPGHWARFTAMYLNAAIATLPAPALPVQEQEPDGYLCSAPPGVWASGPEVTDGQHVQSWKDKGYTCVPYFLASPLEQGQGAKVERPEPVQNMHELAGELMGFYHALDGHGPGDGRFTLQMENGEAEQTRLNLRAVLREASVALESAEAKVERLTEALRGLLRCEYESAGMGLYDCIDNHGKPYQSADLDTQIKLAEAALGDTP